VTARQVPVFVVTLTLFAMRMFVSTTSAIRRSAGILPRRFAYAGFAVGGFLLLTATFAPFLVLLIDWARRLSTYIRLSETVPGADPLGPPRTSFTLAAPERRSIR